MLFHTASLWTKEDKVFVHLRKLPIGGMFCLALMVATLVLLSGCDPLFGDDSRPSPVDATPIAELTDTQIENLEAALEGFRDLDYIIRFDVEDKEISRRLSKTYDLYWLQKEPHSLLLVSVSVFKNEEEAIKRFNGWVDFYDEYVTYTLISNDNNTDALLCDSRMIRGSDTLYLPDSKRHISSIVRLGNTTITLFEDQERYNLDKNISTKFITQLCEMAKAKNQ
jgi:hypothetical protein